MVLRILFTKWSSYPDMLLSSQLLGLNENFFFFPVFFFVFVFFFFSFYLLFLLKPSPIFFISFSNWFLCSSQAFDCNTLRTSNSSSCYSCNMDIPAWSFLFHFEFMISSPYWVKNKKIAHNQLNAEGLVSSGAQKAIKEIGNRSQGGEEKHLPPPPPLSGRRGKKKKNNSSQDQ